VAPSVFEYRREPVLWGDHKNVLKQLKSKFVAKFSGNCALENTLAVVMTMVKQS
jgi:hypothetical protein